MTRPDATRTIARTVLLAVAAGLLLTAAAQTGGLTTALTRSAGEAVASELNATAGCAYLAPVLENEDGYCWTFDSPVAIHKPMLELALMQPGIVNRYGFATRWPWERPDSVTESYNRFFVIDGHLYAIFLVQSARETGESFGFLFAFPEE